LATPCDTFAPKLAKQKKNENNKMFKYIVKNEGIAFDDERHYKGEKNTPMTILKVIT
jgi:hypothetical protein